jgi:hypothetical protein
MKSSIILICSILSLCVSAQPFSIAVERNRTVPLLHTVNLSDQSTEDWEINILNIRQQPAPASDYGTKKDLLNAQRLQHISKAGLHKMDRALSPAPVVADNFIANPAQGTPNDNHIAISNGGKIVSVVNTNIRVYNESGAQLQSKTLIGFAGLSIGSNTSDPRVLYDPWDDRFIIHFFAGNTSATSKLIVAFSQTNDPAGTWNIYQLSGNYLNDTTWSDYPIVALNDKDFFMTYNHLKDGEDWKTGFRYSAIWQIDKTNAYAGDTLQFNYWHDIKYNGKPIWNVCVAQPSYINPQPQTYFVSVRPSDLSNDTVFLHTISDSYESGNAQFSTQVLQSNLNYGLPPNGLQTDTQFLATNDARVLSAFTENNKVQYVQNTIDPATSTASVYVGVIDNVSSAATVTGQIISAPGVDFAYPSIAYMGNNEFDNRALITCSYSSPDTFPGTVAFYRDAQGNISDVAVVKNGLNTVDVMMDSVERWGDYTGIQRKFNEPNTAWVAGSYVFQTQVWRTWVAKIINTDSAVVSSTGKISSPQNQAEVFPNPAIEKFSVKFESAKGNFTSIVLKNLNGQVVKELFADGVKAGTNIFSFNTAYLPAGIYHLVITDNDAPVKTEKIIIQR